ncbi:MAG: helix-turn-helix domain-containing protein [Candidatus Margulisiibacteriota bacterium]
MKPFTPIPAYPLPSWVASGPIGLTVSWLTAANPFMQKPHPHTHPYYQLVLIEAGRGTYEVDFRSFEVGPGSLVWIAKGQVHSATLSGDLLGYCVSFSEDFLITWVGECPGLEGLVSAFPPVSVFDGAEMGPAFEAMARLEGSEVEPFKSALLGTHLKLVCLQLAKVAVAVSDEDGIGTPLVQAYRRWVDRFFRQHHDVEFYAEALHVNAKHLNELVKHSTGQTASHWIHERLILEAKRLLCNTLNPIADIAVFLGFEDTAYFYRYFKRYTGQTPLAFRLYGKRG